MNDLDPAVRDALLKDLAERGRFRRIVASCVVLATLGVGVALAAPKHKFESGKALSSFELNENFAEVDARLTAVEARPGIGSPTGGVTVASALLDSHNAASIVSSDGNWISAVTKPGTGEVIVTITPGVFTTTPNCVAGTEATAAGGAFFAIETATRSSLLVTIIGRGGSAEEREFSLICVGK